MFRTVDVFRLLLEDSSFWDGVELDGGVLPFGAGRGAFSDHGDGPVVLDYALLFGLL